jgi:UDP-N-acetylglucosamine 2-epimerase (non-hydrolysing)
MRKIPILNVVGARPNFMKMAPLLHELSNWPGFISYLVHTGQHYDDAMSKVFFHDLQIPSPDFNLDVGSGSHAVQTAEIMKQFEKVCIHLRPELVIVAGDVNSTLACSLTAAKLQIPVAHIEAGLRSFDRSMPEEINRILTDSISAFLFTTEASGNTNLRREGIAEGKIHFVGNTMIDSLVRCAEALRHVQFKEPLVPLHGMPYFIATIHRPANVDDPEQLHCLLDILESASQLAPLIFVTHPRTIERLRRAKLNSRLVYIGDGATKIQRGSCYVLPPLGYLEFLQLMSKSTAVLTDSGGVQEETTFLGIPCLTLRNNTERPVTIELGTNQIVGLDGRKILTSVGDIVKGNWKKASIPPLWDGKAAERIVGVLSKAYGIPHVPRCSHVAGERIGFGGPS